VDQERPFVHLLAGRYGRYWQDVHRGIALPHVARRSCDFFGGGYFCSRSAGSIARTDVRRILPTLAGILAGRSQAFAEALAAELEKDRNLGHKPVTNQIGPLLNRPLAKLTPSSRPLVFIIDALDDCSDERELAELLRLLAEFESEAKVKFILTSRPELHIRGTPISNPEHNTILQLHTINMEEVMSDYTALRQRYAQGCSPECDLVCRP